MTAMRLFSQTWPQMPQIDTERLILRAARMSDTADMYRYSSDPAVSRHVLWETHATPADTRGYIRYLLSQYRAGETGTWAIVEKESGRVVGTIGFMWLSREHKSAEVGYSLARDVWNRGYATEALRAVLRHGFLRLRLNRIEAQHETDNPASGRVMQHVGMRYEGLFRQRLNNKGRYVDVAEYAILRSDDAAALLMKGK